LHFAEQFVPHEEVLVVLFVIIYTGGQVGTVVLRQFDPVQFLTVHVWLRQTSLVVIPLHLVEQLKAVQFTPLHLYV
jgi:hypothetical protein